MLCSKCSKLETVIHHILEQGLLVLSVVSITQHASEGITDLHMKALARAQQPFHLHEQLANLKGSVHAHAIMLGPHVPDT